MAGTNITEEVRFQLTYSNTPYVIICVTGVVTNFLLLIGFAKDPLKCFRNSATYLVMNLCVTDCLTCALGFAILTVSGSIIEILYLWIGTASFASILAVSINRFILVAYPIKHRVWVEGKIICPWIAAVWIVSLILPVLKIFHIFTWGYVQFTTYGVVMIIIILSAFIYACTYAKLKEQSKTIALQNSNESRAQQLRLLKEKQFLKTIILVACIAFVCIVPSIAFFIIFYSLDLEVGSIVANIFIQIFICLYYINFAINPVIYVIRLPNYRKTFRILYLLQERV